MEYKHHTHPQSCYVDENWEPSYITETEDLFIDEVPHCVTCGERAALTLICDLCKMHTHRNCTEYVDQEGKRNCRAFCHACIEID